MKQLDFINKRLCEKNEARACINNVDDAILEYYLLQWVQALLHMLYTNTLNK